MATTQNFIEYVCEQIAYSGDVRYKKMFGEYMVYVNERPIFTVCNNTVYIKMLDCLKETMTAAEKGSPYQGAKEHYILDIENGELTASVVPLLVEHTPLPKPRKTAKKGN